MKKTEKYIRNGIYLLALVFVVLGLIKPVSLGLAFGEVLIGLAIMAALAFPVVYLIQNPKQGLKALLGLVTLALVFLVSYAMASDEEIWGVVEGSRAVIANPTVSRLSEAGIYSFMIIFSLTIIAFIWGEIRALIK